MPPDTKPSENTRQSGKTVKDMRGNRFSSSNENSNDGSDECLDAVNSAETANQSDKTALNKSRSKKMSIVVGVVGAAVLVGGVAAGGVAYQKRHSRKKCDGDRQSPEVSSGSGDGSKIEATDKEKELAFLELIHLLAEASDMTDKKYPKE